MKIEKYNVTGMTCSACVAHVEKSVRKMDGVKNVNVNLLTNSMTVEYEDSVSTNSIIDSVQNAGYGATVKGEDKATSKEVKIDYAAMEQESLKKRLIYSFAFLIPLFYLSMGPMVGLPIPAFLTGTENALIFAFLQFLLAFPIFIINKQFFIAGYKSSIQLAPTMDALVAMGSGAALVYGVFVIFRLAHGFGHGDMDLVQRYAHDIFFESGATILTLITLGKYLEARSKRQTSDALNKLIDLSPQTAIILQDGEELEIDVNEVKVGDLVVVKPGQKVPVDGIIEKGMSSLDESALTGESIPVFKQEGDTVISASINTTGHFTFRATKVGKETTFSQIIQLLEDATASKAPISRLADKISNIFVPTVIAIAVVATIVWLLMGYSFEFALSIGIAVLIISCPCALGLATPVAIMVGTGKGAENGILFKSAEALEIGGKVNTVVFDKTGTITEGNPEVTDIITLTDLDAQQLLQITASIERQSEHPISKAIISKAGEMNIELLEVNDFENVPGKGIRGKLNNSDYSIGNLKFIYENITENESLNNLAIKLSEEGKTLLFIANNHTVLGLIAVEDTVKATSKETIDTLKALGLKTVMLTGDNKRTAMAIQRTLGFDDVIAEVMPQDKDRVIQDLQSDKNRVAMVGDGINDAPALARADLGIAVGSGTDVAIESADVILMKSNPLDVLNAIRLSKSVIRNIKENLFWAFFYNILGIPIAAGLFYLSFGLKLNPMFAALAMSLSSVTVVLNALRLKTFKAKKSLALESQELIQNSEINIEQHKIITTSSTINKQIEEMKKTLTIEGMTCGHCVMRVDKALNQLEGVTAKVDLATNSASVEISEGVTDDLLKKAVEDAGYEVTAIA